MRWKHRLDIRRVWSEFEEAEKNLPGIYREVHWFMINNFPDDDELTLLVEEMEDAVLAGDVEHFDLVWNAFYDFADAERILVRVW